MFQLSSDELITIPFCSQGTEGIDYVLPPISGSESSLVQTQEYGIPPVQQQDPDFGGKPVRRDETNGALRFYSNVLNFVNQGGQFTFDATQAAAIGGYSQGAVLWCESINGYLVSLIDNNTANFVTNPEYIDNVNWKTVNGVQCNFNRRVQIIASVPVTSTLGLSFAFSLNDIVSTRPVVYNLPNVTTLPTGTTICLKNRSNTRMINSGQILMNPANGNDYYKLETSPDGWIIDGQPWATYSPWATQAYVAANTQRYYSLLITSNTTWTCPANVTQIYVTLIGGGGSGGTPTFTNGNSGEATIAFGLTADGGNGGKGNGNGGVKFGCAPGGNGANAAGVSFPGAPGNGGATWIGCGGGISGNPTIGGGGRGIASSGSSNNAPGGGGGSSGQLLFKNLVTVIPNTTYTIIIGAGGFNNSSDTSGANGAVLIEY